MIFTLDYLFTVSEHASIETQMDEADMASQNTETVPQISPGGYTDDFGPNVSAILVHGTRKIVGRVPARVRNELRAAVAAGVLRHMPKDGLKPEIFYHPDRRNSAIEIRNREALYATQCIAGVVGFNPATRGVEAD